jgi:hypothetical protein
MNEACRTVNVPMKDSKMRIMAHACAKNLPVEIRRDGRNRPELHQVF